jgi:hypothetical protein
LARLPQASAIHIKDEWNGLSDVAPVIAEYNLQRVKTGFRGQGVFSQGYLKVSK